MTALAPVRVVVVEDSLVQRAHLVRALQAEGDITVVGEAEGAVEAIAVVDRLRPDVVTLDLVIPDGGGQHAIEQIMGLAPTPILVLSATVDSRDSAPAIDALVAGAVDAFPKPRRWTESDEAALRRTIRSLRAVKVIRHPRSLINSHSSGRSATLQTKAGQPGTGCRVVAIAASTGGPRALATVLSGLGELRAPVLVVQHIHPDFVGGLVQWMGKASELQVCSARSGERLTWHRVHRSRRCTSSDRPRPPCCAGSEPVTIHRPSADELMYSVTRHAWPDGIGVILTGMGEDGAAGLLELRRAGGVTIAQDASTSAVFGMPNAADRVGAVTMVAPLQRITTSILPRNVESGHERRGEGRQ